MQRVHILDSHTEGEPTRLVLEGGPDLGRGPLEERREIFRRQFDTFRSAVVNEPRGADHVVGALLCEPHDPSCAAGVLFFNNAGYLGMCGHGTIGLVVTLAYLGRLTPGTHRIETPVGVVTAILHEDGQVSVNNVPAYRWRQNVPVQVRGVGTLHGDIAWGGNWFFLVSDHGQQLSFARREDLTLLTRAIKDALAEQGITGRDGAEIDHIELFGPPQRPDADSRNFVLCPGYAYDRSPCGTGTSAKLACLANSGILRPNAPWRQESILGTLFTGQYQEAAPEADGIPRILPTITGSAFVMSEGYLLFDPRDPLRDGVRV